MGQVPITSYGVVGDGRVAKHFSNYLRLLNIPFKTWSRRKPETSLADCTVILILISDSQIENFFKENESWMKTKTVIHFSGSLSLENIFGYHPLMTFTNDLYDLETYRKIVFIGEKGATDFKTVFPQLNNKYFVISKEAKALYHAMCVMSGNFTVLLWQNFFQQLKTQWDIPESAAFPYLEQVTKNLMNSSNIALTGPLQRKDFLTIERNQKALAESTNPKLKEIYNAFVETYL
jgi:predicted short-subunit dehydrogenase-like oxidoreductase (DUF2520 family)